MSHLTKSVTVETIAPALKKIGQIVIASDEFAVFPLISGRAIFDDKLRIAVGGRIHF